MKYKKIYSFIALSMGVTSLLSGWFIHYPVQQATLNEENHLQLTEDSVTIGYLNDFALHHLASTGTEIKRGSNYCLNLQLLGNIEAQEVIHFLTLDNYQKFLYQLFPTDELQAILTQKKEDLQNNPTPENKVAPVEKSCPT